MIKKLFSTLLILSLFSFLPFSSASAAADCSFISDANYDQCCSVAGDWDQSQCDAIQRQRQKSQCTTVDSADQYAKCCRGNSSDSSQCLAYFASTMQPGQISAGAPQTSATNGSTTASSSGIASPQSGSSALKECTAIKFKSLFDILVWVKCIITAIIIPGIFTLAFLFFLYNVFVFMRSSDKTNKEEAKQRMVWGIIALFVMIAVWGIIRILSNTFGLDTSVPLLQTEYLDTKKASK